MKYRLLLAAALLPLAACSKHDGAGAPSDAATSGVPAPAFAASLAYYDGLRAERLPAALIQAQRDFFGAHTYRRVDREGTFHTRWSADRVEEAGGPGH